MSTSLPPKLVVNPLFGAVAAMDWFGRWWDSHAVEMVIFFIQLISSVEMLLSGFGQRQK